MEIGMPVLERRGDWLRLWATVRTDRPVADLPDRLWYEFPADQEASLTPGAEGFAVPLLLLAMGLGEDLHVRGTLPRLLLPSMAEYQQVFRLWYPDRLRPVRVRADVWTEPEAPEGMGRVLCTFSGGVDSFYTLYRHRPGAEEMPEYRLTDALFVHGFDIPLADEATYATAAADYGAMLARLGVRLLRLKTNVRAFVDRLHWDVSHGAALIGAAFLLRRGATRLFIPSSKTYAETEPYGSDYRLDSLLSLPGFTVCNDGAAAIRLEKVETIARWDETQGRLRVCWVRPDGLSNCGRCAKCLRTMVTLEAVGALGLHPNFPSTVPRDLLKNARVWIHRYEINGAIRRLKETGRHDLARDLTVALRRNQARSVAGQLLRRAGLFS